MDVGKRLSDLPPELLSIVVGHLAPSYENRFKPGQKKDLQSANFAHRCLRQWVPQFLFRNMCLMVVAVGFSSKSKLEGMLVDPLGLELAKHIRNVQLKVWTTNTLLNYDSGADVKWLHRFHLQSHRRLTKIDKLHPTQQPCVFYLGLASGIRNL
jgi:hypothetical protein